MAEIFLARQWGEGSFFRDVVIKRLFPHLAENEQQLRMFMDEARLLSQLSHPNIPQAYDVGHQDGYWFIAMEYVEGLTVADLWRLGAKAGQVMPLNVALAIIVQACEALHHAHERKDRAGHALRIVHRDVTPQNLMLTRDGVVKLMDFGIAATSARKDTEAGAVRGTFAYMAPEQVRGKQLDKRADVFAIGVVLYELTTGTRLFRGTNIQIMTSVVEQDVPPPSTRVPGYPADLEQIVLAALVRDRGKRIPSAAHLGMYIEELAMRNTMLVGPRAIVRYFSAVAPAEPVLEEALGMVDVEPMRPRLELVPDSEARRIWGPEEEVLPDIDESELLDDLQLLSVPVEEPFDPSLADSLDTEETGKTDLAALDRLLDDVEASTDDPSLGEVSSDALELDDLIDEADRPIVLLGEAVRKSTRPADASNYMSELEKRLSGDGDD